MSKKIQRTILRDEVRHRVLDAICRGSLAPGAALGEVELSSQLGISRTPLREALVALERDGFVVTSPGRGFAVAPLLESEMAELYPLIGDLEAFALRAAPLPSAAELERLRGLNERLSDGLSLPRSLALDEEWHRTLIAGSRNRKVLAVLEPLKSQVRRFEFAFSRLVDDPTTSMAEHAAVLDRLAAGDRDGAVRRLEQHWRD